MAFDINYSTFLFAPPDEVMELLTNADFIQEWSGQKAAFEGKVGGKVAMFNGWVSGVVTKISDNELAYTWKTTDWTAETPASEVHFKLEPVEHGTETFVKHTNLPSAEEAEQHKEGWKKYFFDPIGDYLSNRKF